jgi:DNA-binding PadR family transcriptional regulator
MALLALVDERPIHGYELKAEFDRRTGGAWPLNFGQVYTTLQRLERDALIVSSPPTADGQVVYRSTDAGKQLVSRWYSEPLNKQTPTRDELAMKLAVAAGSGTVDMVDLVQKQRSATVRALRDLTRLKATGDSEGHTVESLGWALALESLVFHTEAEVRWLDHVEARLVAGAGVAPKPDNTSIDTFDDSSDDSEQVTS